MIFPLARRQKKAIDLLITDVIVPQMNGRQLTEQLVVIRPELRCLFMSGCTAELVVHQGVAADQDLFIQKPFSIQTLAIKVREALNREDGAEGQTVADHA